MSTSHPDGSGAALRRCTGLGRAAFGADYWSREPLLSRHPGGFADLLCAADVDELLTERGLRTPFFRVVQAGQTVAGTTRSAAAGNRRITDLVEPEAVRESYASGATLILNSLHRIHPPLVRFCRTLASELGHPTQCNAYVTPPGSRGFAPHHDTHDVFVLQVDGAKKWNVYSPALTLPLTSQPSKSLSDAPLVADGAAPLLSVMLEPGDALYLPRGYIHAAETNEQRSIHLTVGVTASTAYDVLRDVLELAADEESFRRSLPLGGPEEQLADVARIVAQAAAWLNALPGERARDAARKRVSRHGGVEPLGMLASEDALLAFDKSALVRPREGLVVTFAADAPPDRVVLQLPDRSLSLPAYVEPAVNALLEKPCQVSDLGLPVDDALVLVRRLLIEGMVTVASGKP
ncbi:MAG TPA: cupin domain-containing protein [Frankiaceae bacterium]|nr:cupin domain-containing protein [Frankiaceae bacterium]